MNSSKKISVVIRTYNVESIIKRCLDSVAWADEIIVVDMYSCDKTEEICRSYPNVRLFKRKDYINANLNYGIEQATGDWIMRLDSDEVISPQLASEIRDVVSFKGDKYDGYYIPCNNYVFGKHIRYCFGKDASRPTLFKKGYFKHRCKSDHELPTITGQWGKLKNYYYHYAHPLISVFVGKMNYYTDRDVERKDARIEFSWFKLFFVPLKTFIYMYFKNQGFRDGSHGLIFSILMAFYKFVEYAKLWEVRYSLTKNEKY